MRLIDADALLKAFSEDIDTDVCQTFADYYSEWGFSRDTIEKAIQEAPTIDAVPVIRCRECKHWRPSGSKAGNSFSDMEYIGGCEFTKYFRRESDFCSYGERKEGVIDG